MHVIHRRTRTGAVAIVILSMSAIARGQNYAIDGHTIDGGGQTFSTGGTFSHGGTIGQPDAGPAPPMTGGAFELTGGFWPGASSACTCPGDMDGDSQKDGLDIQQFVACVISGGTACSCADVNGNNMLDPGDV